MIRKCFILIAFLSCAALWVGADEASACAGCRNPSLPQGRLATGSLTPGELRLGVTMQGTALKVTHPAGCAVLEGCQELPVQPRHNHELFLAPVELQGGLVWAWDESWALELRAPVRVVYSDAGYTTPGGAPYTPLDAGIHHRDEVLVGLADAQVGLRGAWALGSWWLTARGWVSLPLGHTEPDPFALGDQGKRHQHIQLGSGTFDPGLGLELSRTLAQSQWSLYGQYQRALYANSHGFQAGERALVGAQGGWRVTPALLLALSLEGALDGPERWGGEIAQDGLLGRRELLAGGDLSWALEGVTLLGSVRGVVARELLSAPGEPPGEVVAPVSVSLGAWWTL